MLAFPFYTLKDRIICNKVIYFYARQFSWLKGECYDSVDKSHAYDKASQMGKSHLALDR